MRAAWREAARWLTARRTAATTAVLLAVAVALTEAGPPPQPSVTTGTGINAVRFFAGLTSPVSIGASRIEEVRRQLTVTHSYSGVEAERRTPPTLVLEWAELPTRAADVLTTDGRLSLRVINLSPLAQIATVTVVGDAGSPNSRTQSSGLTFNLPGESLQVVSVRAAPVPADSWGFSGAMTVHVRACPTDPALSSRCRAGVSAPAYFHPGDGQTVRLYGALALVSKYRSGDLLGASIVPPRRGTLRIMGGRPLTTDRASDRAVREER